MALQRSLSRWLGRVPAPLLPLLPGVLLVPVMVRLLTDLHAGGVGLVVQFWGSALQPSLEPVLLRSLSASIGVTLVMAVLSWLISSASGLVLGLLCSRRVASLFEGRGWLATTLRRTLAPVRALHELVWGLLLLQLFGLNGWVAVLAISLPYSALMARVVADQIDQKPSPAAQALLNGGSSPSATLVTAVVPEAASGLLSHSGHRLDCALRSAVLLGVFLTFNNIMVPFFINPNSLESSEILVTALYRTAFEQNRFGFSAAFAFVIFLILLAFTIWYVRATNVLKGAYES